MADAAFNEEIRTPRAARALALATAFFFCSLTAGALIITVLGKVHRPEVMLDLAAPPQSKIASQAATNEALPPPVVIDKPLFAGTAP